MAFFMWESSESQTIICISCQPHGQQHEEPQVAQKTARAHGPNTATKLLAKPRCCLLVTEEYSAFEMLSSNAIYFGVALGLFASSHAAYVYPRGLNTSTTPQATPAAASTTTQPASITSCPIPLYTYYGTELESIYTNHGAGHYEQSYLSMYENFLTDDAYFQKFDADPALKFATDPSIVSKVDSYITSLYHALATESTYLWGAAFEAAAPFYQTTDPCLFTTCTNQYWSHKSASSSNGEVWFNTAAPPCCGNCVVQAGGVQLYYWPTPNPTPSVTAYEFLPGVLNITVQSPTVVIIMTDIAAYDNCKEVGDYWTAGYGLFDPTWLSTSSIQAEVHRYSQLIQTWTPINFRDFGTQCTCTKKCKTDPLLGPQTNLCTPQMSMPGGVRNIDPAWATCDVAFQGVFDPPQALQQAGGLFSPITTPASEIQSTSSTPSPSPSPSSPTPSPTTTPVSNPSPSPSQSPGGGGGGSGGGGGGGGSSGGNPPPNPGGNSSPGPNPASNSPNPSPNPNPNPNPNPSPNPNSPAPSSIQVPTSPAPTPVVVAGTTVSVNPQGFVVIGGTTVTPGGSAVTVSGTVVSLAPGGTQVVIAGTTSQIGGAIITPATTGPGGLPLPTQVLPGNGAGKLMGSGSAGMLNIALVLIVGMMAWL